LFDLRRVQKAPAKLDRKANFQRKESLGGGEIDRRWDGSVEGRF